MQFSLKFPVEYLQHSFVSLLFGAVSIPPRDRGGKKDTGRRSGSLFPCKRKVYSCQNDGPRIQQWATLANQMLVQGAPHTAAIFAFAWGVMEPTVPALEPKLVTLVVKAGCSLDCVYQCMAVPWFLCNLWSLTDALAPYRYHWLRPPNREVVGSYWVGMIVFGVYHKNH